MENNQIKIRRVLPFDTSNNQSIKEINKKIKVMAYSSAAYNQNMDKFYQSPKHADLPKLKSIICNEKKSDRSNINISPNNLSNKICISIDNQNYLDTKFKIMCDLKDNYHMLMRSKIKGIFDTNLNKSKIISKIFSTEFCYLPCLTKTLDKSSDVSPKASNVILDNILDSFFETKTKGSTYNKSEVKYDYLKMNMRDLEENVIQTIRHLNGGGDINKSEMQFKKVFNSNLKSEMKLNIKPFVIEFTDLNSKKNSNKFNFPYELIPLLFLCDNKETIEFLFYTLKLKENKENEIEKNDGNCNFISINENNLRLSLNKNEYFLKYNFKF